MRRQTAFGVILFLTCSLVQAQQWDFMTLRKPVDRPIIEADSSFTFLCPIKGESVRWQRADVFNPAAIVKDDRIYLLLRCEDNPAAILGGRTSRIGLAYSDDGIHFTKYPTPVLYPDTGYFMQFDYPGGCEDPRVVQTREGLYVMAYTSWNQKVARLSIAFSKDLIQWQKQGPAFMKAYDGKFHNNWSKSGSIITKMDGDKIVAARLNGKYWMYWGENAVHLAWSENLADWIPVVDEKGDLKNLISPRKGMYDSHLTECGPPAIMTPEGIVLFYNGRNAEGENTDPGLPQGTYSVGKVVFDLNDPEKVVSRTDQYILKPSLPHEMTGQYKSGTTFAEGLVFFKGRWFMYYGTADSFVGLAVSE